MKGRVLALVSLALISAGCSNVNIGTAISAGSDLFSAATMSDESVQEMATSFVKESDRTNKVAPNGSKYAVRLAKLTKDLKRYEGRSFDFRAYIDPEINAFALANGAIRVNSGLMDKMSDDELLGVIGHEIGHVIEGHSKEKIRLAYAASAARKGVASHGSAAGRIAGSQVGGMLEAVLNSQFSQSEESEADDYGVVVLKKLGKNPKAMAAALRKLADPSGERQGGILATHPDPLDRAERIEAAL